MITGQSPQREWKTNLNSRVRSLEEAVSLARKHGVAIPDEVEFHVDESVELHANFVARGPRVDKLPGQRVYWSDFVHQITGKVPFRIWPGVLSSDEAIVTVIAHEMHELLTLRPRLESGGVNIDDLILHTEPGRPGNLHDEAWDVADQFVDRMRGATIQ